MQKVVLGLVDPLQFVKAVTPGEESDLHKLLESAVAGLLLHTTDSPVGNFSGLLERLATASLSRGCRRTRSSQRAWCGLEIGMLSSRAAGYGMLHMPLESPLS